MNKEFKNEIRWAINGKFTPLSKLNDDQLHNIIGTITRFDPQKKWYGVSGCDLEKDIKKIVISRYEDKNSMDILKLIHRGYHNRAARKADIIIKTFKKSNLFAE